MKPMRTLMRFLLLPLLLLAACTSDSPPVQETASGVETEAPVQTGDMAPSATARTTEVTATDAPTPEPGDSPTAAAETPTVTKEAATSEPEVPTSGRTDDGAYFLGRTDAPVTIIDYSDFL